MDTRVTEGQKRPKQPRLARACATHQDPCWWCSMLCVLVCGCDLLKHAPARQTAEAPAATRVAQSSNQVAAPPTPRPATIATPTGHTPQPLADRTTIVDPPPAPASNPAPTARPAKSNQKLPGASAKVQTSHTVTNSVANPRTPQTTVTYMTREAATAIVIKGPPRQPEPRWSRTSPLCLGMGVGAVLIALVFRDKRGFRVPSGRKAHKDELFLPSEFKLKDSAIRPEAPLGILAPEKPACSSKMELLVSVLASTINAIRFFVSKFPLERVGTACQAVWQRMSTPLPAISEQSSSRPLSPEAADPGSGESSATAASPAEYAVQSKPAESVPSPPSANPGVPASEPLEAPTLEPKTASKVADETVSAPSQLSREAPVHVS